MSWKRLPGSQRLFVDASSGRRGRRVRNLAGTSDWRRDLVDRAGIAALRVGGTRWLPDAPPLSWPAVGLDVVAAQLHTELAGLRLLGIVAPRQHGRQRLSAVGRMTGVPVVVKIGGDDARIHRERLVLDALASHPLPGIATPTPVAAGTIGFGDQPATYLVTTAIALDRQRAAVDEPLRTFEHDLGERLATVLPVSTDPSHVPVHGDLTPWNLRSTPRGLALFDWEAAGWGEPGSDLENYRSACDDVRRPWARTRHPDENPIGAGR